MEQKYKGAIKDFPDEIVNRMLECQVEQGNPKDVSVFENDIYSSYISKGFLWENTKENHSFWSKVLGNRRFEKFYELYPKKQEVIKTPSKEDLLLKEANRRFPIGSKFKSQLGMFSNSSDEIQSRTNPLRFDNYAKDSISGSGERFVYYKGEWAKPVEEIPEYVEYIDTKYKGKIVKVEDWTCSGYCKVIFYDGSKEQPFKHLVKPSTKEAYEAQNSKIVDRTKYYKVNNSQQYEAVLDYFKSKGEKANKCYDFVPGWEIVYFDGNVWRLGTERHVTTQTPEDIKMLGIVESKFESVLNSRISKELGFVRNPCLEIPLSSVCLDEIEGYPTKETIKTQVITTDVIDIQLKTKKKKQLFTI